MGKVKFLLRNITLLNLILMASIVLIANYAVLPFFDMKVRFTPAAPKVVSTPQEVEPPEVVTPAASDYMIIAEMNLFHPERKIPQEKEDTILTKPEFVLYGTLITDDVKLAYMEDRKSPRTTPGRGKRQTVLKLGQTLSGFTLKEIEADRVVMVRGEETIVLKVIEPDVKKDREGTAAPAKPAPEPAVKKPVTPTPTPPPPKPEQPITPKRPLSRPSRTQ